MKKGRRRRPIVFDEPSYAMGKREWYKEVNQALVKTIESQRFLGRPLFIPIINTNLLDKTVRSYLIQFRVVMLSKGRAMVYRIEPSQHEDKIYRHFLCSLEHPLMDSHLCAKPTCLDCKQLWKGCNILRARYERKKDVIQKGRYRRDLSYATERESRELTMDEIMDLAYDLKEHYVNEDNRIESAMRIKAALMIHTRVHLSHNKAYELKALLETKYSKEFLN